MKNIKNHKQMELFNPWANISPKRYQMLEQGWAGLFQNHILQELPVKKIAAHFHGTVGRKCKELSTVLGTLLLQQTFDYTDEQTIEQLAFNIQWHFALNITAESDDAKYMSLKTLWSMRNLVAEHNLESVLFDSATNKLSKVFEVDTDKQRIDSVHIKSNMRRLGRISIFVNSIHRFLKNLKRQHNDIFDAISDKTIKRYLPQKALNCFSMVKPSETKKTLLMVSNDLFDLVQQFKDTDCITQMHSYKLLERILKDHCNITDSGATLKESKDVPSDSLQNPSDPDATYSGHKGQGYQVQIMETYTEKEDKSETLNLITYVEVERAHESDVHAVIPAIESTQKKGIGPKEALADSLYNSDDNQQKAASLGVEIVAPNKGKAYKYMSLSEFDTQNNQIVKCPEGHKPVRIKKNKTCRTVVFKIEVCAKCPHLDKCPVESGKKNYYLRYTEKKMRNAQHQAYTQTDEFKDRYRYRAGVEATMSEYNRRTGVKQLRVRGYKAVHYSAFLKALGLNILRAAAVYKAKRRPTDDSNLNKSRLFEFIKEQFIKVTDHFINIIKIHRIIFKYDAI